MVAVENNKTKKKKNKKGKKIWSKKSVARRSGRVVFKRAEQQAAERNAIQLEERNGLDTVGGWFEAELPVAVMGVAVITRHNQLYKNITFIMVAAEKRRGRGKQTGNQTLCTHQCSLYLSRTFLFLSLLTRISYYLHFFMCARCRFCFVYSFNELLHLHARLLLPADRNIPYFKWS